MRVALKNVETTDGYEANNSLRLVGARRLVFQIANAAIEYELDESPDGKGTWTEERFLAPSIGSFDRICSGVRVRSSKPGTPARISIELLDELDLTGGADSFAPFTARVAEDGGVDTTVPGTELAYQEFLAEVVVTSNAEAAPTKIVEAAALDFDGQTEVFVEFFSAQIGFVDVNHDSYLALYDNGNSVGRLAYMSFDDDAPVRLARRLKPSQGSHVFGVGGFRGSGPGGARVQAGPGGATQYVPGFIRVTAI